jgi:mannosyltransferase
MKNLMHLYSLPTVFWIILALGLSLRLFHLGSNDFWIDELGVARAAFAPSPWHSLDVAHSHVMAMPMDYIVTWLMGRVAITEGWLRLPSALWGSLTLLAAFLLYRQVMNQRAALWGVFFLALSPVLIMYSQELRFYAPLIFFYTMSSALGLKAVQSQKFKDWLAFILLTITGILFHIYVAFTFVTIFLFSVAYIKNNTALLRALLISFITIFTTTIIAVLKFGSLAGEHSPLFAYEAPSQVILVGLGYLPPFPATWSAYIFGFVLLMLTLLGLMRATKKRSFVLSIAVQIGAIIVLDSWFGYFASMRQLLPLLPLAGIFPAQGLSLFFTYLDRIYRRNNSYWRNTMLPVTVMVFFLIIAGLVIIPYYRTEKTSTRAILKILEASWTPGELILVSPSYNMSVYEYYAPWLKRDLHPIEPVLFSDASYIISEIDLDISNKFDPLYEPLTPTIYPQILWVRQ